MTPDDKPRESIELDERTIEKYYEQLLSLGIHPPVFMPEVPLYKYRGNIDYALDEIKDQYIYTSYPDKQNDPFDSSYQMTYEEALDYRASGSYFYYSFLPLHNKRCYKNLSQRLDEIIEKEISLKEFAVFLSRALEKENMPCSSEALSKEYYDKFFKIIPRRGLSRICCFSEIKDSIPMWAYYANNHSGVCFKYDFSLLDLQDRHNKCILNSLHKVWYSNNKPKDSEGNYSALVKAQAWAHEQEWRIINWKNTEKIFIPCMAEIYLGINSPIGQMERVIEAIKVSQRDIKLYRCRPNLKEYKIDFIRIDFSN